ncbi:MAG: putative oxidoreductase C-terminal domain-containing protein [Bacteroidota bacterium]|nr:putative oxidoreductase C-terminal domain-containing protein [Bacteroidota bacterium]
MNNKYFYWIAIALFIMGCTPKEDNTKVKLMTLDPGHFHAALIQKTSYKDIDNTIDVYAPEGPEVKDFLSKIKGYNNRAENPTNWTVKKHLSNDYLEKMIAEKPGNVMVVSGKNSKKIDYVMAAVNAGLNVYADKPLVVNQEGFEKLQKVFEIAKEKNLLVYDIMTERFEVTTGIQKALSMKSEVFGVLLDGTPSEPSISKESVHHLSKIVSGKPLVRPAWFLDTNQQGEGIVDVTTHLVDLVQWEAFPGQIIDQSDIKIISSKRWTTSLTPDQFMNITGLASYPEYLVKDVKSDTLNIYCNGEINYTIKGKHAKVSVIWDYKAPKGTGDTHYSVMRGSKSDLIIKQGEAENYKPTLYVISKEGENFESNLEKTLESIQVEYPGIKVDKISDSKWKILIPEVLKIGHEAHFGQVTDNFLKYYKDGKLPEWEVPNMITKYYTTTQAYKKALE